MVKRQRPTDTNNNTAAAQKKPKLEITSTSTIFMSNMLHLPQILVETSDEIVSNNDKKLPNDKLTDGKLPDSKLPNDKISDKLPKSQPNKQLPNREINNNIELPTNSNITQSEPSSNIISSENDVSRPQTPVYEQTSDNRHLQSQTEQVNITLAISSRRFMPVLFNSEEFSEDEAEDLLEEMEDALDAMQRIGWPQYSPRDAGYCSEDGENEGEEGEQVEEEEDYLDDF